MNEVLLYNLLPAFLTSAGIALIGYPILIKIAILKELVDIPDRKRKLHRRPIPTLGGIVIAGASLIAYFLCFPYKRFREYGELLGALNDLTSISAVSIIILLTGIKDDITGLDNRKKLIIHILCAFILAGIGDIRLSSFYGLFGMDEVPYWLSLAVSMLLYVVLINGWNMIDGIDGLAISLCIVNLAFLLVGFWESGAYQTSVLCASVGGASLIFLMYNRHPARIYMGTTGANFIGMVIAVMLVKFIEMPAEGLPSWLSRVHRPLLAIALVSYPLLDVLRIVIVRLMQGRDIFAPDRNHLHHFLRDRLGFSHALVTLTVVVFTAACVTMAFLFSSWPTLSLTASAGIVLLISLIIKTEGHHEMEIN